MTDVVKGSGEVVLVVDDDDMVRDVHSNILKSIGYRVVNACHPEQALQIFKKDKEIKLGLLDYHMPMMNGLELTRIMRKIRPDFPVVLISGNHSLVANQLTGSGKLASFTSVHKPIAVSELSRVIRRLLDGHEAV